MEANSCEAVFIVRKLRPKKFYDIIVISFRTFQFLVRELFRQVLRGFSCQSTANNSQRGWNLMTRILFLGDFGSANRQVVRKERKKGE